MRPRSEGTSMGEAKATKLAERWGKRASAEKAFLAFGGTLLVGGAVVGGGGLVVALGEPISAGGVVVTVSRVMVAVGPAAAAIVSG
jgi:hypothetical protein